jgi:heat shock protein HtpX
MTSLYTHQESNIAKTWTLMGIFLVIVIALGWILSYLYQAPEILWIAVVMSIGMNLWAYWFSDKLALSVSRASPASREQFFDLYTVTENLAITAGLPMPKLYTIDDPAPNAFATGRNKEHAAIAVTTGLLERLERTELEGVIAHELSHIGNRDILISTIVVVLAGFISLIADFFLRSGALRGGNRDNKANGVLAIIGIVFIILSPIVAALIRLAVSRRREFLADASGALLTRYPEGLARALEKIATHGAPLRSAHQATAHLFIENPFGAQSRKGLSKLFMTHPPVEERIRILRGSDIQ